MMLSVKLSGPEWCVLVVAVASVVVYFRAPEKAAEFIRVFVDVLLLSRTR